MTKSKTHKIYKDLKGVADKARPFEIKAKGKSDTLAILVHGFTSSPYFMRHLAEYLSQNGIDAQAVLLAGHGRSRDMLEKTRQEDWIDSVRHAVKANVSKYKNIYFIGHSLGANIGLCLSLEFPGIMGIIALGPSIFIRGEKWQRFFLVFYRMLGIKSWKKIWLSDSEAEKVREAGGRVHIPIKSIVEFYSFIDNHSKRELSHVKVPILIVHSRKDKVSHPKSSLYLFENVKSQDKEIFILDKTSHGLLDKTRRDFLFRKFVRFIKEHNQ